ncbi:MAG: hypothetical protein AUI10_00585 [Actinobacteria bacterium 13_2_20CM_2_72_6]|nr:MAG: hypothetical protein AUI10_00585 [Actinobacteria bacterium 13_2_20CM_2_72_6]
MPGAAGTPGARLADADALGDGPPPPPHDASLSVQFDGLPGPEPRKPKLTEAPGATVPFQDRFRNV